MENAGEGHPVVSDPAAISEFEASTYLMVVNDDPQDPPLAGSLFFAIFHIRLSASFTSSFNFL